MKATELLAMYERVADAPDAVEKLRRFVLELAVRGRLVEQDASSAKANSLRLDVSEGAPISDAERFVEAPESWSWKRICELGTLAGGMTPAMGRADFWNGDIVWLSPKDIKADEVADSELKITKIGLELSRLRKV